MNRIPSRPIEVFLQAHYLAKTFDARQRLRCYLHNFEFLAEKIQPFSLAGWFGKGLVIFEREVEGLPYRIALSMPPMHRNQGELAISLWRGDAEIYAVGFTVIPGEFCGAPEGPAILVSRMQGAAGRGEDIHAASKDFRDITPQALIFSSLQGCARALGLSLILGTSARIQLSFSHANPEHFLRCYDVFFESVDAQLTTDRFYMFDCSRPIEVFENLPVKHRSRTKAKRKLKAEVDDISFATMKTYAIEETAAPQLTPVQNISAIYLATEVGAKKDERIVTEGRSGLLVCGPFPYARLDSGRYEVRFAFDTPVEPVRVTCDVSARRGRLVLARSEVSGLPEAQTVLRLALEQPEDEVEFRVFVSETTKLAFRGVTVLRDTGERDGRGLKSA